MPLANTPVILNLLDGPVDVGSCFLCCLVKVSYDASVSGFIVPKKSLKFRMLDLISRGAQGHGPVHLLLISAAEIGFGLGWR